MMLSVSRTWRRVLASFSLSIAVRSFVFSAVGGRTRTAFLRTAAERCCKASWATFKASVLEPSNWSSPCNDQRAWITAGFESRSIISLDLAISMSRGIASMRFCWTTFCWAIMRQKRYLLLKVSTSVALSALLKSRLLLALPSLWVMR